MRKILIMGLPGAGKTTLAREVAKRLNAVHFNADAVRAAISPSLGFSIEDRITHARRMGWLCDQVVATGGFAVADFICPTAQTRAAFFEGGQGAIVFVDRPVVRSFKDTSEMFEPPLAWDMRVHGIGLPDYWAERLCMIVRPIFDPVKPTALLVGRWQPFHDGHKVLVERAIERVGQVCIAVRNTHATDDKNPFGFEYVRARIEHGLREYEGRFVVVPLPNVTAILYGRDVGYTVERIELDAATEAVSGTEARNRLNSGGEGENGAGAGAVRAAGGSKFGGGALG